MLEKRLGEDVLAKLKSEHPDVPSAVWNALFREAQFRLRHHHTTHHIEKAAWRTRTRTRIAGVSTVSERALPRKKKQGTVEAFAASVRREQKKKKRVFSPRKDSESVQKEHEKRIDSSRGVDEVEAFAESVKREHERELLEDERLGREELAKEEKEIKGEIRASHKHEARTASTVWEALQHFATILRKQFSVVFSQIWHVIKGMWSSEDSAQSEKKMQTFIQDKVVQDMKTDSTQKNGWWEWFKSVGSSVIENVFAVLKATILPLAWSVIKIGSQAFMYLFETATSFLQHMYTNPHTVRILLLVANYVKGILCKQVAAYFTAHQEEHKKMRVEQVVQNVVKEESAGIAAKAGQVLLSGLSYLGLGNPLTFLITPFLGMLSKALQDTVQQVLYFYTMMSQFKHNASLLLDLIDPSECIAEICHSFQSYEQLLNPENRNGIVESVLPCKWATALHPAAPREEAATERFHAPQSAAPGQSLNPLRKTVPLKPPEKPEKPGSFLGRVWNAVAGPRNIQNK